MYLSVKSFSTITDGWKGGMEKVRGVYDIAWKKVNIFLFNKDYKDKHNMHQWIIHNKNRKVRYWLDQIICFTNNFIKHSYISAVFHQQSWFKGKRFILNITAHDRHSFPHFYCTLFTLVWLHFSKTGYDVTKRTGEASHVNEQLRRTVKDSHGCWVAGCERTRVTDKTFKSRHLQKCGVREAGEEIIIMMIKWVERWWEVSISLWFVGKWLNQTQPEQ